MEYAKSVAHLTQAQQFVVAQAAAKHAKTQEQDNQAKAASINGIKLMAEAMTRKINMSKEKNIMNQFLIICRLPEQNVLKKQLPVKGVLKKVPG